MKSLKSKQLPQINKAQVDRRTGAQKETLKEHT